MSTPYEIPITADNQTFSITLAGTEYQMQVLWRESYWALDLMTSGGTLLIGSIPLVLGENLLGQYAYLSLGFQLWVFCDDPAQTAPTQTDLGSGSHLIAVY